jgi:hypothetical protein
MSEFDESEVMKKARNFRFRKGALDLVQRENLSSAFDAVYEEANWLLDEADRDILLPALGYDESELEVIMYSLTDLLGRIDDLSERLNDTYVTEYFNDYLVGSLGKYQQVLGYDQYETDYFSLCEYEAEAAQRESGKRLMRLPKEQLIAIGGQCFGILIAFLDLKHEYECLTAVFGLIKDERAKLLDRVSDINIAYEEWAETREYSKERREAEKRLDKAISYIPYKDKVWVI